MGVTKYDTKAGKRWQVHYTKPDGTRTRKRGFRTKAEAQAWTQDQGVAQRAGTWVDPTRSAATINTVAEAWLPRLNHLAPTTKRSMDMAWRVHVKPQWGHRKVSDILPSEIQAWVSSSDASSSTVRRNHSCLKQILDVAVKDKRITVNPAKDITLPSPAAPKKVFLTISQVKKIADETPRHPEIVWLLATTGMRWSEVAGLKVGDIDLETCRIHIQRAAVTNGHKIAIGSTKTGKGRVIAMPQFVANLLLPIISGRGADEWVWARADGEPMRRPGHRGFFDLGVSRARKKDETLPRVTLHGMRHVAAGLLVSGGANVKVVQRQLGHSSAAMTLDVYAELFDDDLESVATVLDKMHSEATAKNSAPKARQNENPVGQIASVSTVSAS